MQKWIADRLAWMDGQIAVGIRTGAARVQPAGGTGRVRVPADDERPRDDLLHDGRLGPEAARRAGLADDRHGPRARRTRRSECSCPPDRSTTPGGAAGRSTIPPGRSRRPGGVGFERSTGYENLISLDVGPQMYGKNASCYIRIPFLVPGRSPEAWASVTLKVRYDDGFVAYLNGVEIARRNFTGVPRGIRPRAPSTTIWTP